MAETILLNGVFKDNITPQLRKLERSINQLNKSFTKFGKKLKPIARDLGKVAAASERLATSMKDQKNAIDMASRSWVNYKKQVGKAGAATQRAFPRGAGRPPAAPRAPRVPVTGPMPRGGRASKAGRAGLGFTGMAGAVATGNAALAAVTASFYSITGAARGFVMAGSQAEQGVIQMAGTLQTLGKVGDFGKSRQIASEMMTDLAQIAAALPGSTQDYLTILQQTLDDQIQAFGSADAVRKNLAEGERSFTALFGMSAQLAGLRPAIAAMDINQLRANPNSIRNVQLLTRNPTLQKYYLQELKKNGGDWFKALKVAMGKAITPEQVEALKQSFDSAFQSFITSFTDPYSGIFGATRKVSVMLTNGMEESISVIDKMGMIMRVFNEIVERVWGVLKGGQYDPMVILIKALDKFETFMWAIYFLIDDLIKGEVDFAEVVNAMGNAIGEMFGSLATWIAGLDYNQFFKHLDKFISELFTGIIEGFTRTFEAPEMGKGVFFSLGQSVTGTIIQLLILNQVLLLVAGTWKFIAGLKIGATIAGWLGAWTAFTATIKGAAIMVGGFLTTILLPVLAVAGAFMILVAIVRNFGNILKLLGAGMKLAWASYKKIWLDGLKKLMQGIESLLRIIPGAGWLADQAGAAVAGIDKEIAAATAEQTAAQQEASEALQGMADQFKEDSKTIRDFFARGAASQALSGAGPAGGPKTYTVSGVTYDSATGRPVAGTTTSASVATVPVAPATIEIPDSANPVPVLEKIETQSVASVAATEKVEASAKETVNSAIETINKANTDIKAKVDENKMKVAESATTLTNIYALMQQGMKVDIVKSIPIPMQLSLGGTPAAGTDQGGPSVFNGLASMMGLMMTSGYRPNDTDSYHGINRARDYAGDPAQMLAFAQMMSSTFGGTLKELIYTPLGYSIKNGKIVPPYAQGTHYDHVHVAYGMGGGNPAFFSSKSAAQAWERRVAPSNSAIASVTSNSSEMGGRNVTIGSINISGVDDPKAIAEVVADEIMNALDRSSYTSLYNS